MSEFLLLGARGPGTAETSPARAARDVVALSAWHQQLRRWGLLRAFALPLGSPGGVRACLIVRASGQSVASWLAEEWERRSGYEVAVLPLSDVGQPREPAPQGKPGTQ